MTKKGQITKSKVSISIDKKLLAKLQKEADERMMKLSNLLEYYIKKGKNEK
ncbi:hypothetical protein ACFL0W_02435 [Nanoarchaeota archaeon]